MKLDFLRTRFKEKMEVWASLALMKMQENEVRNEGQNKTGPSETSLPTPGQEEQNEPSMHFFGVEGPGNEERQPCPAAQQDRAVCPTPSTSPSV